MVSVNAMAEGQSGWTATIGVQSRDMNSSLPSYPYRDRSTSTTVNLLKRIDPATYIGGNLAYRNGSLTAYTRSGNVDTSAYSGGIFSMRNIGGDRWADVNLGYGTTSLGNSYLIGATLTTFTANTQSLSAGLGLTQNIPLSKVLNGSLSARYTYVKSDSKGYVKSNGSAVPGSQRGMGFVTLGGGLSWHLARWQPSLGLNFNQSNGEFIANTGDKNFFGYHVGIGYAATPRTRIGLAYSGTVGESHVRDRSFGVSITTTF